MKNKKLFCFNKILRKQKRILTLSPKIIEETSSFREDLEKKLYEILSIRNKHILLYGNGGTGKTYIARKLFSCLNGEYKRLAWVEYGDNLAESLIRAFKYESLDISEDLKIAKIIDILSEKPDETILFIDDVKEYALKDDMLSRITGLGITILITSRCEYILPYEAIKIGKITDDDSLKLFIDNFKLSINDAQRENISAVISILNNNPKAIILFAKNILKQRNIALYLNELITFIDKNSEYTLTDCMNILFEISPLSFHEKRAIQCLYMIPKGEIPEYIFKMFSIENKYISALLEKNILELNSVSGNYILHDIIRECVKKEELSISDAELFIKKFKEVNKGKKGYLYKKRDHIYEMRCIENIFSLLDLRSENAADIYEVLGLQYDSQFYYTKALTYYYKSLEIYKTLKIKEEKQFFIYKKIAVDLCEIGKYSEALEVNKVRLKLSKEIYGTNSMFTVLTLNSVGICYESMGDYEGALKYYEKALNLHKKIFKGYNRSIAGIYSNIGTCYDYISDYDNSIKYHTLALRIREKILSANDIDVASSYYNLGCLCLEKGNIDEALEKLQKALDISNVNNTTPNLKVLCYICIGHCYKSVDNYDNAMKNYNIALSLNEKTFGTNHIKTAEIYNVIGQCLNAKGQYKEADEIYQKALTIQKQLFSEDGLDVSWTYNCIGDNLFDLGNYDEALKFYYKTQEIQKSILPENHINIVLNYTNIGRCYLKEEQLDKAKKYIIHSLICIESSISEETPITAYIFFISCTVFHATHEYDKALYYGNKSIKILKDKNMYGTLFFYNILVQLCEVYYSMNNTEKVIEILSKNKTDFIRLSKSTVPSEMKLISEIKLIFEKCNLNKTFMEWINM